MVPVDNKGFLRTLTGGYGISSPILISPDSKESMPPSIICTGSTHDPPVNPSFRSYSRIDDEHKDDDEERCDTSKADGEGRESTGSSDNGPPRAVEPWVRTILESDPSFLTPQTLIMALENKAPAHVIKLILGLNPKVVSIPMNGPTPLQVAIRNDASLDIIHELLLACPFGLCVTNTGHAVDPLTYAKRYCQDRPGLIELLSRPLSYWVSQSKMAAGAAAAASSKPTQSRMPDREGLKSCPLLKTENSSFPKRVASVVATQQLFNHSKIIDHTEQQVIEGLDVRDGNGDGEVEQRILETVIDHEEVQNVKKICSQLWKVNKKMAKEMLTWKHDLMILQQQQQNQNEILSQVKMDHGDDERHGDNETEPTLVHTDQDLLQMLKDEQHHHFYRQIIALDMKEKSFKAHVLKTEAKILQAMDDKIRMWQNDMQQFKDTSGHKFRALQVVLDNEVKVNSHFRTDLAEWFESWTDSQQEEARGHHVPSYIFATNLGETRDEVPLCGDDHIASTEVSQSDLDDSDDDRKYQKKSSRHLKGRTWRHGPYFRKNRCHIPLTENEDGNTMHASHENEL